MANHPQFPVNVQPADDTTVFLATTPAQRKWSFQRGEYERIVMQANINGTLQKRCTRCLVWKEAAPNFDRHNYDGFAWYGGWYYSYCRPCSARSTLRQAEYQWTKQQQVAQLRATGDLRYDDPDNPPIMCSKCFKVLADGVIEFDKRADFEWCRTCNVCQEVATRRCDRITQTKYVNQRIVKFCKRCGNVRQFADFVVQTLTGTKVRPLCAPCRPLGRDQDKIYRVAFFLQKQVEKMAVLEHNGCPGIDGGTCMFGFCAQDQDFLDNVFALIESIEYPGLALDWHHPADKTGTIARLSNEFRRNLEIALTELLCKFCHRITTEYNRPTASLQNSVLNNVWRTDLKLQRLFEVGCSGPGDRFVRGLEIGQQKPQPAQEDDKRCPFGFDWSMVLEDEVKDLIDEVDDLFGARHGGGIGSHVIAKCFDIDEDPNKKWNLRNGRSPSSVTNVDAYLDLLRTNYPLRCVGCHGIKTWHRDECVKRSVTLV